MSQWIWRTDNEEDTKAIGRLLATHLFENAVLRLEGDFGAGKTTFTKGLAEGLGIERMIKSPSYTLIREYDHEPLSLYHMDFYRLEDSGMDGLSLEDYWDRQGVIVIEWAEMVDEEDLTENYLHIKIERSVDNLNERTLYFQAVGANYQKMLDDFSQDWHAQQEK